MKLLAALFIILHQGDDSLWKEHAVRMVKTQIEARGIKNPELLNAMSSLPRHLFVPEKSIAYAYEDHPVPIGYRQTISQPYIVAFMTEQLQLEGHERVLEIGTGSGYQAAVLSLLCDSVFTIEIIPELAASSAVRLKMLGFGNVVARQGDGYLGWPGKAPFDAIIVTAAPEQVPEALIRQLKTGGRMIIPVGDYFQDLVLVIKEPGGIRQHKVLPVRFVPMVHPPGQASPK